jgi:hypothetical protein
MDYWIIIHNTKHMHITKIRSLTCHSFNVIKFHLRKVMPSHILEQLAF